MENHPFSIWLIARDGDTAHPVPESTPLRDAGLWEDALVIDALWKAGRMSPTEVRKLRMWEVAVLLGASEELNPPTEEQAQARSHQAHRDRRVELLRQRVAHAHGQGPAPEAPPVDTVTLQAFEQALR